MYTLTLELNEIETIANVLQKSDPMGIYTIPLVKKIVDQTNTQIEAEKAQVVEPIKEAKTKTVSDK